MKDSKETGPLFKEGDIVTIIERKGCASDYKFYFSDSMAEVQGRKFAIRRVLESSNAGDRKIPDDGYLYVLEGSTNSWASSMFEESYTLGHSTGIAPFVRRKERPKLDFDL